MCLVLSGLNKYHLEITSWRWGGGEGGEHPCYEIFCTKKEKENGRRIYCTRCSVPQSRVFRESHYAG
jgi:hypothetical protein